MPDQTFTVTFDIVFANLTTFAFGMAQYKMGDYLYIENFESKDSGLTNT